MDEVSLAQLGGKAASTAQRRVAVPDRDLFRQNQAVAQGGVQRRARVQSRAGLDRQRMPGPRRSSRNRSRFTVAMAAAVHFAALGPLRGRVRPAGPREDRAIRCDSNQRSDLQRGVRRAQPHQLRLEAGAARLPAARVADPSCQRSCGEAPRTLRRWLTTPAVDRATRIPS
jgi:hypothetical protein